MKIGDYVRVEEGVYDEAMDNHREGLIIEHITPKASRIPDQFVVMFPNNTFLKFHRSQLIAL